jgi:hypothetical protein
MPGPDPTPGVYGYKDLRTWLAILAATIVALLGVIVYLLSR